MASNTALTATGLACTFWNDRSSDKLPHIRVYYQDSDFFINEVKWDNGSWVKGSQRRFGLNLKTPLAALTYPGDNQTTPSDNPEIHVYYLDNSGTDPKIIDYKKSEDSDTWSNAGEVPTYNLSANSAIGCAEYSDPYIRVYYQDKDGYIRESNWNSYDKKWVKSTGGSDKRISSDKARIGTPIAATVGINYSSYPKVTVIWQDTNKNIAGAVVSQDVPTAISFPTQYAASPTGSLTVAAWDSNKTYIYYDGKNDGIQKLEYKSGTWSGPVNSFTGDITNATASGQGSLASAAYSPANAGQNVGSVFYQPVNESNIVEVLL